MRNPFEDDDDDADEDEWGSTQAFAVPAGGRYNTSL